MADKPTSKPARKTAKSGRLGDSGEAVRRNVRRLRDAQGISGAELSAKLGKLDRPIPLVGIQRIESGERRVDADDLVALAAALDVSPITLLMPAVNTDGSEVQESDRLPVTGYAEPIDARLIWSWLKAEQPLAAGMTWTMFVSRAWPNWVQEQFSAEAQEHLQATLYRRFQPMGDAHGDD